MLQITLSFRPLQQLARWANVAPLSTCSFRDHISLTSRLLSPGRQAQPQLPRSLRTRPQLPGQDQVHGLQRPQHLGQVECSHGQYLLVRRLSRIYTFFLLLKNTYKFWVVLMNVYAMFLCNHKIEQILQKKLFLALNKQSCTMED